MFQLNNKTAIVTGGASGIGLAVSQLFAKQGAYVHILELNFEQAQQVVTDINATGGKAKAHQVDVSKQTEVVAVINQIAASQPIGILINNAGVAHIGKAHTTTEADFDRIVDINIKGMYHCLFAAIPHFLKTGGGVIINMASIAASVGLPDRFAYSMSKGAVLSMTLSVAKDYLENNIRCNSISPARVHTPFVDGFIAKNYPDNRVEMFDKLSKTQPIGRMATTNEIAAMALYLCSDEAAFITGNDYLIDGGFVKLNN